LREPVAQFDPDRLVELFDAYGVDYVLVGGYAGLLHGSSRPTIDLDMVPAWDDANLSRLCDALRSVDARSITGPVCEGDAITPEVLAEREIMNWATRHGRVDTMVGIPDAEGLPVDYRELASRAEVLGLFGVEVEVASLEDVIISKEFAGRAKDAVSLPELRRLRDAQPPRHAQS